MQQTALTGYPEQRRAEEHGGRRMPRPGRGPGKECDQERREECAAVQRVTEESGRPFRSKGGLGPMSQSPEKPTIWVYRYCREPAVGGPHCAAHVTRERSAAAGGTGRGPCPRGAAWQRTEPGHEQSEHTETTPPELTATEHGPRQPARRRGPPAGSWKAHHEHRRAAGAQAKARAPYHRNVESAARGSVPFAVDDSMGWHRSRERADAEGTQLFESAFSVAANAMPRAQQERLEAAADMVSRPS